MQACGVGSRCAPPRRGAQPLAAGAPGPLRYPPSPQRLLAAMSPQSQPFPSKRKTTCLSSRIRTFLMPYKRDQRCEVVSTNCFIETEVEGAEPPEGAAEPHGGIHFYVPRMASLICIRVGGHKRGEKHWEGERDQDILAANCRKAPAQYLPVLQTLRKQTGSTASCFRPRTFGALSKPRLAPLVSQLSSAETGKSSRAATCPRRSRGW